MRKTIVAVVKFAWVGITLLYCFLAIVALSLVLPEVRRIKVVQRYLARHWTKRLLNLFNLKITLVGEAPPLEDRYSVVCNHVSYIDTAILPQHLRVAYLSRHEVAWVPIMGWVFRMGGVHYINRKDAASRERGKQQLQSRYEQGIHLGVFAEGTTSDGTDVLPFKKAVFELGQDVVPCAIKYRTATGFNPAWFGKIPFFPHAREAFSQKWMECRLRIFPKLRAVDFPDFTAYQEAVRKLIRDWVRAPWGLEEPPPAAAGAQA